MPAPCHKTSSSTNALVFRFDVEPSDCKIVRDLVTATGKFYEDEIAIAVELVEERLQRDLASGYEFIFAHQALNACSSDQGSFIHPAAQLDLKVPHSLSPHSLSPHSLSPHSLSPHSLSPHPKGSIQPDGIEDIDAKDSIHSKDALVDANDTIGSTGSHEVVGFACYGKIPCTRQAYDLYWIAVHPAYQGRGLGRQLLSAVEAAIRAAGGTQLYADTSGRADYEATREYYLATGFEQAACLTDFYAPDDDKIIFRKLV